MFYQYLDPYNTYSYAEVMKDSGYDAILCDKTFLYVKKTFLGRIGQVFYPTSSVNIPPTVRFCEIHGLLEPLPYGGMTDYNINIHVDLSTSSDIILRLDKQRRWGIRKALQRGAEAYSAETKDAFNDFWEIYSATAKRRNNVIVPKGFLERIFRKKDLAKLFIVEAKNQTIGAYFTLYSNDLARFFQSGFLLEFKYYHPNELGHYYALQYFQKKRLKVYDMGGAGKTPESAGFKIGWGKTITIYHCQFRSSKMLTAAVINHRKTKIWMGSITRALQFHK